MDLTNKMRAAVMEDDKIVSIKEFEIPEPAPGEVLIKIKNCLLCTWEQRIYTGESSVDKPFIPGHEASGEVVKINKETTSNFREGDKVVFKTLDHCGHCYFCYQGYDNQCVGNAKKRYYKHCEDNSEGIPGSGGLAQYIALPVERVFPLSKNTSLEKAAFAEPLACCIHSIKRGEIKFGDNVVIFGAGIMGQLHVILARLRGGMVYVIEPAKERRDMAKQNGAHQVINPESSVGEKELQELANNVDLVINTVPKSPVAKKGMEILNKMGKIIFYASYHPNKKIEIDPNHIHYSEISITGSSGPATEDFLQASQMIDKNLVSLKQFITEKYALDEIGKALERSLEPDVYRVLVSLD